MFPFAALGFIAAETSLFHVLTKKQYWISLSICYLILCLFAPTGVSHWNTGTDLFNPEFTWQKIAYCSLFRDFLAFSGCVFIVPVLRFIWKYIPLALSNNICSIGRNTLAIYVLQSFIIERLLKSVHFGDTLCYRENTMFINIICVPVASIIFTYILGYSAAAIKKLPIVGGFIFGFKLIRHPSYRSDDKQHTNQ